MREVIASPRGGHNILEPARPATDPRSHEPERFETRFSRVDDGMVAVYEGDVAYDGGPLHGPGPRHRLWMVASGWRYERD